MGVTQETEQLCGSIFNIGRFTNPRLATLPYSQPQPPIPRQCCGILRTEWETRGPSSFLVSMLTAVENHQNEPLGRSQSLSRTQTQRGSRGCRSERGFSEFLPLLIFLSLLDKLEADASSGEISGNRRQHNFLKPTWGRCFDQKKPEGDFDQFWPVSSTLLTGLFVGPLGGFWIRRCVGGHVLYSPETV